MASHCCAGLLPIPCCARQHDSVAHLSTTCQPAVAECPHPAQSASTGAVGKTSPTVEPMGSPTSRPASLSRRTLLRHSSFVRAVCVDALVRICAGGDQQWSSLPRQLRVYATSKLDMSAASPRTLSPEQPCCNRQPHGHEWSAPGLMSL